MIQNEEWNKVSIEEILLGTKLALKNFKVEQS
jgi:hypothetical protein